MDQYTKAYRKSSLTLGREQKEPGVRHSPKPADFVLIISDTVERVTDGMKDYLYCALDIKSGFAPRTLHFKRLTSMNIKEFCKRFLSVYTGEIIIWQSDNGSENLGSFNKQLKKGAILHVFYPRCPRINAFIERYNRTTREEFISDHLDRVDDKQPFNRKFAEYPIFYNIKRVHKLWGIRHPLAILLNRG